jgi:hypothetical protein
MRKPAIITTPFLTVEEVVKRSNLSPRQIAEVMRLADKIIAERENGRGRRVATKRAAKTGTATKKKRAATANRIKKKGN